MVQVIALPIALIRIATNELNQKIACIAVQKPGFLQLSCALLIDLQFDANGGDQLGGRAKLTGAL